MFPIQQLRGIDERVSAAFRERADIDRAEHIAQIKRQLGSGSSAATQATAEMINRGGVEGQASPYPNLDPSDPRMVQLHQVMQGEHAPQAIEAAAAHAYAGPREAVGRLMGDQTWRGGLARGTVMGGGVTAGGAAMTAGAQKLLGLMGILEEADETEVARDLPLTS